MTPQEIGVLSEIHISLVEDIAVAFIQFTLYGAHSAISPIVSFKLTSRYPGAFLFLFLITINISMYVCSVISFPASHNISIDIKALQGQAAQDGSHAEPTSSVSFSQH